MIPVSMRRILCQLSFDPKTRIRTWRKLSTQTHYGLTVKDSVRTLHGATVEFWQFAKMEPVLNEDGSQVVDAEGKPKTQLVQLDRPIVKHFTVFHDIDDGYGIGLGRGQMQPVEAVYRMRIRLRRGAQHKPGKRGIKTLRINRLRFKITHIIGIFFNNTAHQVFKPSSHNGFLKRPGKNIVQ